MKLVMAIGNKEIDSVPINLHQLTDPEYIASLKAALENKHIELIESGNRKPVFYIEGVPSSLNQKPGNR